MQTIAARNVHQVLPEIMHLLKNHGKKQGAMLKVPGPVSICYEKPTERVVFWPEMDTDLFLHCLEALRTLLGYNGQLKEIASILKDDRYDWHQVLCDRQIYFSRSDIGDLDMIITSQYSDTAGVVNASRFSMLQEYVAVLIGCGIGKCWYVTNNLYLHLDDNQEKLMNDLASKTWPSGRYSSGCPYQPKEVKPTPLIPGGDVDKFDTDVAMLLDKPDTLGMTDWFIRKVCGPMLRAIRVYESEEQSKNVRIQTAQNILGDMPPDSDWRMAGFEWLERRRES